MADNAPGTGSDVPLNVLIEEGRQILGTKYAFIGWYAVLLYEHFLTFPEEHLYIWKRRLSAVSVLFLLASAYAICHVIGSHNLSVLDKILRVTGLYCLPKCLIFSTVHTISKCRRFARFMPFAVGIPLTIIPSVLMGLRVLALYNRRRFLMVTMVLYYFAELVVAIWTYSVPGDHPLELPPDVHADAFIMCMNLPSDNLGNIRSAAFQFMETVYDTVIFLLVIFKTAQAIRFSHSRQSIAMLITKHSLLYFAVIFSSNLVWALMIAFAPSGLRYSTAIPTLILVCVLVNRLTLDLRAFTTQETVVSLSTSPAKFASESMSGDKSVPTLQFKSPPSLAIVSTPDAEENTTTQGCVSDSRCGLHTSTSEYVEMQYLSLSRSSYKRRL